MKKLSLLLLIYITFTACTKTEEIKIVEPPKEIILNVIPDIDGDLNRFATAKNEKIKITFAKDTNECLPRIVFSIPIKIKFTESSEIKSGTGYNHYGPKMELEFLNKEGKVIEKCSADMETGSNDLADYIKSGNGEEFVNFKGSYLASSMFDKNTLEASTAFINALSTATSVRIKSEIIEEKADPNPNESVTDEINKVSGKNFESSSGSEDCSEFLDGYEKFMGEYIVILKKYKNNPTDASILSEYTSLMTEAQDWATKTKDCGANPEFSAKFATIQMKIANAMR